MSKQPVGYFVHHQGRGHAERAAALLNVLVQDRPVEIFTARPEIFTRLDPAIGVTRIPSLFEPTGEEAVNMRSLPEPAMTHCAPLGWPTIRTAMASIAGWFGQANPALFVTDVSAELGQLARLCSVPHVAVLQHGRRGDIGHMAATKAQWGSSRLMRGGSNRTTDRHGCWPRPTMRPASVSTCRSFQPRRCPARAGLAA
ncbi:hypothetical protein [Erythrobacter neustonensis]|uniref:hypothetical protein n=1 Tax=Erythrobacter neustonensis TaxID=1112 RepID=UPI000A5F8043|nr:hypothetical protein [Erythrobacter neustonensis]